MIFRKAEIKDVAQLVRVGFNTYSPFNLHMTQDVAAKMNSFLSDPNLYIDLLKTSTGYVCEIEQKIIGMVFIVPNGNPTELFDGNSSYIRMLGVEASHSGKNIGEKLMQLCIDHAVNTKEKVIALHTSDLMKPAQHIYRKLGFIQHEEIPKRNGIRYWIWRLALC